MRTDLKRAAAKHLAYVALTAGVFIVLNRINELLFISLEQSKGINWVFLPAGIRLLATLLFGLAGFEGLLVAGLYLNFHHFGFQDDYRAWTGAVAGALAPYLAYLFAKHWFNLGPRLSGLTPQRRVFVGGQCGLTSPIYHHSFAWVQKGEVDWLGLAAMIVGDIVGILIVLYTAKGLIALADRYGLAVRAR